jgi:hypothetical protein
MAVAADSIPVDNSWAERNLGISYPAVEKDGFGVAAGAAEDSSQLQRELIEFDSDARQGRRFVTRRCARGRSGSHARSTR